MSEEQTPGQLPPLAPTTDIHVLFDDLPISIRQLAVKLGINEVTLARIRDGKPTSKPTANTLLRYFTEIYSQRYNLRNVTGINITERNQGRGRKRGTSTGTTDEPDTLAA